MTSWSNKLNMLNLFVFWLASNLMSLVQHKVQPKASVALFLLVLFRKWMKPLHALVAPCFHGWWEHHRCWVWCRWCWPVCGWVSTVGDSPGTALRRSSTCTLCAWCWGWSSCTAMVSPHWFTDQFHHPIIHFWNILMYFSGQKWWHNALRYYHKYTVRRRHLKWLAPFYITTFTPKTSFISNCQRNKTKSVPFLQPIQNQSWQSIQEIFHSDPQMYLMVLLDVFQSKWWSFTSTVRQIRPSLH